MFNLKSIIFDLFGLDAKRQDINKDSNNKGFQQRFNELLAGDLDENEIDLINYFIENLVDPETIKEEYLIYQEAKVGLHLPIYTDLVMKRKILPLMYHLYDIKTTNKGYEMFLKMLGFDTVDIQEATASESWDHDILRLDSDDRDMDSRGALSGYYSVILTGTITITDSLKQLIYNVIKLNEPIWATLNVVTYNGNDIEFIVDYGKGSFNSSFNNSFDK